MKRLLLLALCGLLTATSHAAITVTPDSAEVAPLVDDRPMLAEALHWQQVEARWAEQLRRSQQDLAQVRLGSEDLEAHILALAGSVNTYRVLQEQRAALPRVEPLEGLAEAIAELRLRQFELIRLEREWTQQGQAPADDFATLQARLRSALATGVELQTTQATLVAETRELRQSLQDELFWVPSNPTMNMNWWLQLPGLLWQRMTTERPVLSWYPAELRWRPGLASGATLALLATLLIVWQRRRLKELEAELDGRLQAFAGEASDHVATAAIAADEAPAPEMEVPETETAPDEPTDTDTLPRPESVPSPWNLPALLAVIALQRAPISLLLIALGLLVPAVETTDALSIGPVLLAFGFSLFVVRVLLSLLRHPDIATRHFGWSPDLQSALHHFIGRLAWVVLPTSVVVALAQQQTVSLTQDRLSALVLLVAGLAIAVLSRRLLRRAEPLQRRPFTGWLLNLALVILPLGMAALAVLGYVYTVLQLTNALLATFYLLTIWVIAEVSVARGLMLATEKLRRQRALEESAHAALMAASGPDEKSGEGIKPLPQLDINQVTQQSGRLAGFMIFAVLGGLLFWVWYDMILALGNLEFAGISVAGDLQEGLPFNLLDIITALAIMGLTLFLAANLPGLLEMVVLSRLHLQQGTAYATTTLLNYLILGTGLVLALSALGVSWDRLGWLVAALSVGLGFGLQEIFANFVSGLIILFERPIRIGDVVTLGNLSGRVRQIRIRATTITDFDRKDIIVPNKTFVTGQLINWSLTDTVTRITLKLGVAYGSDLERTREILQEAAASNTRVLPEPQPQVLFLSFGDSALEHELRLHVSELGDRNPALDELNRYIDKAFREAGIEIAFQQLDIRLRNSEGAERLIEQRPVQ